MREYVVIHPGKKEWGEFYAKSTESIVLALSKDAAEKKTVEILGLDRSQGEFAVAYTMHQYGKLVSSGLPVIE